MAAWPLRARGGPGDDRTPAVDCGRAESGGERGADVSLLFCEGARRFSCKRGNAALEIANGLGRGVDLGMLSVEGAFNYTGRASTITPRLAINAPNGTSRKHNMPLCVTIGVFESDGDGDSARSAL